MLFNKNSIYIRKNIINIIINYNKMTGCENDFKIKTSNEKM